jgi:muconolactone delta-isomerase
MKYLVLVSIKPNVQPNPEILSRHKDWVLQQVKNGVMEAAYTFAGSGNGMCIITAESPEQLNDITTSAPGFPICDLDVRPLADFAKQMDRMGALLKNMR